MPAASLTESNAALARRRALKFIAVYAGLYQCPLRFSPSGSGVPLDTEADSGGPLAISPKKEVEH